MSLVRGAKKRRSVRRVKSDLKLPEGFELNARRIGQGEPCYVIAEAGVNHNGDLALAHKLVDAAADAGADAVKFQTWITEKLCRPGAIKAQYQKVENEKESQYEMLKRLELPYEWHKVLQSHAGDRGIAFLSTPDEIDSARFLCGLGVEVIKVGSGELSNLPFLQQLGKLGKPLILSTGMGTLKEVGEAMYAVHQGGRVPTALLHCVSAYPAPEEEMNLRSISTLRNHFGVPVGLSDHTMGQVAPVLGVGQGMCIWEKHITLDRHMPGPDHAASAEPAEFALLVKLIRKAELMMGSGVKEPSASETSTREAVRRTLLYTHDFSAGHCISLADFEALRCGLAGLQPGDANRLVGLKLCRPVRVGEPVSQQDFE